MFYPDVDMDTDFIASPTPLGVETFYVLRSQQSPEQQQIDLDLPAGSQLAQDGGGALVHDGDRITARVAPPLAHDADGLPVPVQMSIQDDSLVLSVDFHGADYREPILVDPILEAESYDVHTNNNQCEAGAGGAAQWFWQSSNNSNFFKYCAGTLGLGYGTYTNAPVNFAGGQYSQWLWKAPPQTFIESVDWIDTYNIFSGTGGGICSLFGIYNLTSPGWEPGSQEVYCHNWNPVSFYDRNVGSTSDLTAYDAQGSDGNEAVWMMYFPITGIHNQSDYSGFRGANIYLSDRTQPNFLVAPTGTSAWEDKPPSYDFPATLFATDTGLGMKYFWLLSPNPADATQQTIQGWTRDCAGVRAPKPCNTPAGVGATTLNYKLPEGRNQVSAIAFDQALNATGSAPWTIPLDRTPPVIKQVSGSLFDERSALTDGSTYSLNVTATDVANGGEPASPNATPTSPNERSGVKSLSVFIDGEQTSIFSTANNCSTGTCPWQLTKSWTLNTGVLEEGPHTIRIVAADGTQPRHEAEQTFQVEVRSDVDEPTVDATASNVDPSGNFTYHVVTDDGDRYDATGPNAKYGSGVASIQAYVDGQPYGAPREQPTGSCKDGGCPLTADYSFGPPFTPTGNRYDFEVIDFAQNEKIQSKGKHQKAFSYFGYNDAAARFKDVVPAPPPPQQQHLTEQQKKLFRYAEAGGGRVFRFPINFNYQFPESPMGAVQGAIDTATELEDENPELQTIKLLPVVSSDPPPPLAYGDPACDTLTAYKNFFRDFAARFGGDPHILAIEGFNEPNLEASWNNYVGVDRTVCNPTVPAGAARGDWMPPTPEQLANLLDAARAGIAEAGMGSSLPLIFSSMSPIGYGTYPDTDGTPHGGVGSDGTANGKPMFISGLWLHRNTLTALNTLNPDENPQDLTSSAFAAVGVHLYDDRECHIPSILTSFRSYLSEISTATQAVFPGRPQWVTEVGFPSDKKPETAGARVDPTGLTSSNMSPLLPDGQTYGRDKRCSKPKRYTPEGQRARLSRIFMGLSSLARGTAQRPPLEMLLVHKFYDDLDPLDPGHDDGDEGRKGVWRDYGEPAPKQGSKGSYCALRTMQDNLAVDSNDC